MKKVFLKFYDPLNLGDDLFLHIITKRYRDTFNVVSKNPTPIMKQPNVRVFSNKLLLLASRFIEKYIYPRNLLVNYLINRNDLYVYIGGSVFIDDGNKKRWETERAFYKNLQKPYYILGSNFGPSRSDDYTNLVRDILSGAADVCFRDSASYTVFKDLKNVRLSTDIAFTLDTKPYETVSTKTAVFSIINGAERFDDETSEKYEAEIINLTQNLVDRGYNVIYMSFCKPEGDELAIESIQCKLPAELADSVTVYKYEGNLDESLRILAGAEIIVGGRFHASVLGLLFNKKVVPMAYSDKTINLMNDLGFTGQIVDIRTIASFDGRVFDFDKIAVQDMSAQIVRAEAQFQQLDKVLTRK